MRFEDLPIGAQELLSGLKKASMTIENDGFWVFNSAWKYFFSSQNVYHFSSIPEGLYALSNIAVSWDGLYEQSIGVGNKTTEQ